MQLYAPFGQLNWKRRRMRSLFRTILNCFIRHKPCVAATAQIFSASVMPAGDVALVLIWHSQGEPIQVNTTGFCKMKNIFVAIMDKSLGTDWLEMAIGLDCCSRFAA